MFSLIATLFLCRTGEKRGRGRQVVYETPAMPSLFQLWPHLTFLTTVTYHVGLERILV